MLHKHLNTCRLQLGRGQAYALSTTDLCVFGSMAGDKSYGRVAASSVPELPHCPPASDVTATMRHTSPLSSFCTSSLSSSAFLFALIPYCDCALCSLSSVRFQCPGTLSFNPL